MRFTICKLTFKSPMHLGEREGWYEGTETFIHSDTLFSAFCHSYLLLYGQERLEALLRKFVEGSPPFLISSAFPYWKDELYFPVPKNQLPKEKDIKKISFVSQKGFEALTDGQTLDMTYTSINTIPAKEEPRYPWKIENVPRIALSRLTNHPDGNFFHFGEVTYFEDAGLFFILHLREQDLRKEFEAAINLMSDEGIGGDRSSGKGLMRKPYSTEIELAVSQGADGTVSLSVYYPDPKEIPSLAQGFYQLLERKGYIYSPYGQSLRKKSVRMFTEGSVFPANKNRKGRLIDVTPQAFQHHKVYRYGLFFGIPCKLEVEKHEN